MSDLCKLLDKFTDGTATTAEAEALKEHAQTCAACASELSWQQRERALFASRRTREVAPLWTGVEARIAAPAPRRQASWVAGAVAATAAILLLVKSVPMALHHEPVVVVPAAALPEREPSQEASSQSWKLTLEGVERITVHDVAGTVTVQSTSENVLHVIASEEDELDGWKVRAERTGKEISVRVECEHRCDGEPSVDFMIEVPSSAPMLVVDTVSADVVVDRVGAITAHSVSGDVHVIGSRPAQVSSTSGDISLDEAPSIATKVDSVSGDVTWRGTCNERCNLEIATVSGDVDVVTDARSHYGVDVRSQEGHHQHAHDGAPGRIHVTTVSGDVEVPE